MAATPDAGVPSAIASDYSNNYQLLFFHFFGNDHDQELTNFNLQLSSLQASFSLN